ncbi:MAG: stage III sporulation protein AB [Eubacteriaceae bacterium]|nr:stage III sporulation protein AB [Eubacteriaceae bacterium]
MKTLGMILIMIASYVMSGQVASHYSNKMKYSSMLLYIITDIRSRIEYAPVDIYFIFGNYSNEKYHPFDNIFAACCESGDYFMDVLGKGLSDIREISDETSEIILSAFDILSRSGREGAGNHLKLCEKRLKDEVERIRTESDIKGKMYEKLALLMGVFVCILFV